MDIKLYATDGTIMLIGSGQRWKGTCLYTKYEWVFHFTEYLVFECGWTKGLD